jgi:hypothetical protein
LASFSVVAAGAYAHEVGVLRDNRTSGYRSGSRAVSTRSSVGGQEAVVVDGRCAVTDGEV